MASKKELAVMRYDDFEVRCDITIENLGTSPHFHDYYEIMLIASGSMLFMVEGIQYTIRTGDVVLIHPGNFHHFKSSEPECKRYFLWMSPVFLQYLLERRREISGCFEQSKGKDRLFRVSHDYFVLLLHDCEKMLELGLLRGKENEWLERCYLLDFLQTLNQAAGNRKTRITLTDNDVIEDKRVSRVLTYIDEHLDEPLTLDGISSHFYISKYYLSTLFRKNIGLSVYQYIIQKRLATAYNLLQNGEPALKVCLSTGFSDYSNFLKLFKRQYGMLPKDVQARCLNLPGE